ncbi:MAG: hypothetical protein RLY86_4211 [Pseudomonadota bacterium]|jgi:cytochrome c556
MSVRRLFGPVTLAALSGALLLSALAAPAQADPVAQVEERKANFKKMGGAMKTLATFVKGEGGTAADAQAAAAVLEQTGSQIGTWWPEGTAVGVGKSEAKPEIWTNMAEFTTLQDQFKAAVPALVQAAATGEPARMVPSLQAVGASCKACHDKYKAD